MSFASIRAFILGIICCFALGFVQVSLAQTEETPPETVEAQTETPAASPEETPVLDPPAPEPLPDLTGVDLLDPEIQAALEARKTADQAIIDAVMKQRASAAEAVQDEGEAGEAAPKGGLNPDALKEKAMAMVNKVLGWLKSPSFLAQVGAALLAFFLSPMLAKQLTKRLFFFRDPPAKDKKLRIVWDYVYRVRNFLRAILMVGLLALFAVILKAVPTFGEDWLVKLAQSIAVVFLLYKAIKEFVPNELFRKIGTWTAIPLALLATFGYFDDFITLLESTTVIPMGDSPITIMTLIRLAIFGGLFFYLGNLGNSRGQNAIRSQESLDDSTREVVAKLFQIILFIAVVILVMSFAGIPLSGLVLIFSAVGLGIGLGLQPIAANFVSGFIILFDRSVRKGDFVVLPEGQEGYVEAINMRQTVVETTDGKDIMVPNTTFIDNAYENWTHKDPRQRYEVYFGVSYDTDIEKLEDILIPAVSAHPRVLQEPEEPDLELREFGPYAINFAIEFWVSGIDDGENKFTSDLNFIVWRTLKDAGVIMPLPQREVRNLK